MYRTTYLCVLITFPNKNDDCDDDDDGQILINETKRRERKQKIIKMFHRVKAVTYKLRYGRLIMSEYTEEIYFLSLYIML